MKGYKIAFFEIEPWEKKIIEKAGFLSNNRFQILLSKSKITPNNAAKYSDFDVISTFIYSNLSSRAIEKMPKLKAICTRSTGTDHIDLEYCKQKKIKVFNVPKYGETAVAEHTFALIFALIRNVNIIWERATKSEFELPQNLIGDELCGKTLGVVGTGAIGRKVIKMAKCFGIKILAFDIFQDKNFEKEAAFKYVSLKYLFKNSDIVTFHVPLNKGTYHMLNLKNLSLFKKGCYVINTSRGGICETEALLKGLEKNIFKGVGIDVLEEECFIKEERELINTSFIKKCDIRKALAGHILIDHPKAIFTCHSAFYTKQALETIIHTTIKNIFKALK